jgi:Bacterial Ig domain
MLTQSKSKYLLCLTAFALSLTACPSDDSSKPSTAITSPASDASLSSTTPIQVDATDDKGVTRVEVFVRTRGATVQGLSVGTAVSKPYVVNWDTTGVPNNADLELVAVAEDAAGNRGESAPLRVRTSNPNLPSLNYLVAYSLPPRPTKSRSGFMPGVLPSVIEAPANINLNASLEKAKLARLTPRADPVRTLALEWSWQSFNSIGPVSGVNGYSVWLGKSDLAGSYERLVNQAASTAGTQTASKDFADARVGDTYYGAVRAIINNQSSETGFSNADGAMFPRAQEAATPLDGDTVSDGRPVLTWTPTPGAIGYLYFVYNKNPWEAGAQTIWTNSPKSTDQLSATFPADRAALASGTYYWWVAGVTFNALGKADAFAYSEPRRIVIP